MSESTKRYHSPPTGATHGKKPPKRHMQENVKKTTRKSSFQTGTVIKKKGESNEWSYDDISSLVEYVALYHAPDEASSTVWPTHKNEQFWNKCAEAVNCSNQQTNRTGGACRDKVRRFLKEKFETTEEAEDEYNICYFNVGKTSSTSNGCPAVSLQVHSDQFTQVQSPLLGFSPFFANDSDVVVAESRENTEDVDEDVSVTNNSVHVGRIIRGDPLQEKVNIAGPSSQTIRGMNLGGDFNKSAKIQGESQFMLLGLSLGVSSKKREAASHILIFMLSEEKHNFKPYAIPVWVVNYHSLIDKKMRELNEEMKSAMEDI
ncbi:Hypothetical predicted protein, partial [Paramuricea clavata]